MKKLLFFSLLILSVGLYAQDSVRVSQLPSATDPDVDDIMYFIEDGISTNITRGTLFKATSDSVASLQDSIAKHTDTLQVHQDQIATLQTTSGDVTKVGTPADNQLGVWTGDGTIEGDPDFTFNATTNSLKIGDDGASSHIFMYRNGTNAINRYNWTNTASESFSNNYFRYGGSKVSSAAAPTDAIILNQAFYVHDGTSSVVGAGQTVEVDGVIATADFDVKYTWDLKDGAAASALAMTLDPAGLQIEDGFNVTTLANDDAETNLLAYDTGSGLVTYRSVASIGGGNWTKSTTYLSPTTAGDDVLMPTGDYILFRANLAGDYNGLNSFDTNQLNFYAGGASVMDFTSNTTIDIYSTTVEIWGDRIRPHTNHTGDVGASSAFWANGYFDDLIIDASITQTPISHSLTDGTPTDAEIDAATSTTPAAAGSGWKRLILDSDGSALIYIIISDGSNWQYTALTIAL